MAVTTSFHWGLAAEAARERGFRMRFDVDVPVADWLVCGRKRGEFLAKVCYYALFRKNLADASFLKGCRDVHNFNHPVTAAPWAVTSAACDGHASAPRRFRVDYGVYGAAECGDISAAWCTEGFGAPTWWQEYLCA